MAKVKKKTPKKRKPKGKLFLYLFLAPTFFILTTTFILLNNSSTSFSQEDFLLYIPSQKSNISELKAQIEKAIKPSHFKTFMIIANVTGYWGSVKPGRYVIKKGQGVYSILWMLRTGKQKAVRITINKFRTKKDLAIFLSNKIESSEKETFTFFNNNDSLMQFGVNEKDMMTLIIPNTYEIYWNTSPKAFLERMEKESKRFWDNKNRIEKAKSLGLSKKEVYILASIIEEETNYDKEKPDMASVYTNRLKLEMPLGADPTIKFAYGNFALKRITMFHINSTANSPYNTYKNKGLPPGPICTPSITSIDAVLEGKKTKYLYFCAKEDFTGKHNFASTEEEHLTNARKYRKALDSLGIR